MEMPERPAEFRQISRDQQNQQKQHETAHLLHKKII